MWDSRTGKSSERLEIGGIEILLEGPEAPPWLLTPKDPSFGFRKQAPGPSGVQGNRIRVDVRFGEIPDVRCKEWIADSQGGVWDLGRCRDGFLFRLRIPGLSQAPTRLAAIDVGFSRATVVCDQVAERRDFVSFPLSFPLDELIVLNYLATVGKGGGTVIHACGIETEFGGVMLVGPSGIGKSTSARLWSRAGHGFVLSDDRIILRETGEHFSIYGTPWHGEAAFALNRSCRLVAVIFLEQSDRFEIRPVSAICGLSRLTQNSFAPFYRRDGMVRVLELYARLFARVPAFRFRFARSDEAVDTVIDLLRGLRHEDEVASSGNALDPRKRIQHSL